MHRLRIFPVMALLGIMGAEGWAQNRGINPHSAEIRELEMAVEKAPAKDDGTAWLKLAILHQDAAEYRDSEHAYRRAIKLLMAGNRPTFADALDQMGTMYAECGELAKAEPLERRALAIRETENDSLGIGVSHMHLAVLLLGRRDLASAEAEAEQATRLLVPERSGSAAQTAATPEEKMTALIDLSLVRCARGDCASAIPDLKRAQQLAEANYAANSIPVGFLDFLMGYASWKTGDSPAAGELMKKGIQELETQVGWGHPTYISALRQYRTFLTQNGQTTQAAEIQVKISQLEKSSEARRADSQTDSIQLNQP
jgi:tetratricopeptide (TPR) repeat protein